MPAPLLYAHRAGRTLLLGRVDEFSESCFGGPLELPVEGIERPESLHLVAWLHREHLGRLTPSACPREVPLVHPLRYSGGAMEYAFSDDSVRVSDLRPARPDDAWPYAGYPTLLPYHGLDVSDEIEEGWAAFARRAPNLPDAPPAELVVLVPPPRGLGFTLWGRAGDAEGVTLVFACDLAARTVRTFNVCG